MKKAKRINLKNVRTIAEKEIRAFLDNPALYIVLIVFLFLWQFLFFRNAFLVGEASLKGLFGLLPWLLLIFVPAITMGSISKELDEGTYELIITHPVKEIEIVLGKFISTKLFVFAALLFSLPVAMLFNNYSQFDWGVYAAQLIGSTLLLSSMVALGIYISSVFTSQIASLLISIGASFLFIIFGTQIVTISLPLKLGSIFERLSLLSHYESITRGAIELSDVIYFVLFIGVFLILAQLQLLKRKFGKVKGRFTGFQTLLVVFVILLLINVITQDSFSARIDLTQGKIYTLSSSTKKVLKGIEDSLVVTLYASEQLPAQYNPVLRETKYLLNDYRDFSGGKLTFETRDPSGNSQDEQKALTSGVQKVQFNVVGQEELQLKTGYFGILLEVGENFESIPFVQNTEGLEYELTTLVSKLTKKEKKSVAFLSGHGEKSIFADYRILNQELSKQFDVDIATFDQEQIEIQPDVDVLVVAGPTDEINDDEKEALRQFLSAGKSAVFFIDTYLINNSLLVTPNQNSLADFVQDEFGVSVSQSLVYDVRFNDRISLQEGFVSFVVPYPFWIRTASPQQGSPINLRVQNISFPWASSLTANWDQSTDMSGGNMYSRVLVTSEFAGEKGGEVTADPKQEFPTQNLSEKVIASTYENQLNLSRVVVVGDSDFLVDQFIQRSPQNLALGLSAVSWAAQEESFSDIQIKQGIFSFLQFTSDQQPTQIRYTSLGFSLFVPIILGFYRFVKRRTIRFAKYS